MKKRATKAATSILALALAVGFAGSAMAQDYDSRWYVTGSAGANIQDKDRDTENAMFGTLGVGKFINRNWSVDGELNYQNPKANRNEDMNFSQYGIGLDLRRHFVSDGRIANPYLVGGVGYNRAEEEFEVPGGIEDDKRGYATAKLGAGIQFDLNRVGIRTEIAARHSFDKKSVYAPDKNGFTDALASIGIVIPLGARDAVAVPVAPAPLAPCVAHQCNHASAPVNPPTQGSVAPILIDLGNGVLFDFDRSDLKPQAREILDEAVEILSRYPDLRFEVSGHTDSVGSRAYNQGLSERRARAVYDYFISRGVPSSRLIGPYGFSEDRPVATNETAEGRALNRRTELTQKP